MADILLKRLFAWPALAAIPAAMLLMLDDHAPRLVYPPWLASPLEHRLIFAGVLAVQLLLVYISRDPLQRRGLIFIGVCEKFIGGGLVFALPRLGGAVHPAWYAVATLDVLLGAAFALAAGVLLTEFGETPSGDMT